MLKTVLSKIKWRSRMEIWTKMNKKMTYQKKSRARLTQN